MPDDDDDEGVGGVTRTTLYSLLFEDLPPKDFMHQCKRSINKVKNNPAECRQVLAAIVQWTEDNPMKYSEDSCLGRLSVIVERFLEALDVDELDDKDTMQFMKLMREFFRKVSAKDIAAVGDWEVSSNLSPNLRMLLGRAAVQQSEPNDWVAPDKSGLGNSAPLPRGDDKDSDAMSKAEPKDDGGAGYTTTAQPSFTSSSSSAAATAQERLGSGGFGGGLGGGFGGSFSGGGGGGGGGFDAKAAASAAPSWGSGFGGASDGGSKWGGGGDEGGSGSGSGPSWSAPAGPGADTKDDSKWGDGDAKQVGLGGGGLGAGVDVKGSPGPARGEEEDEEEEDDDEDYDDDDDDDDEEYDFDQDDGEERVPMNMSLNLMRALGLDTTGMEVESDWKPPERTGIDANPDSWKMG